MKSGDMVATKAMLDELRQELKSDFTTLNMRIDSVDGRIDSVEGKIDSVRGELKADIAQVLSAVHRVTALVEEQNNKNNYVLDQTTQLKDRQARVENDISDLRKDFDAFPEIIKNLNN